MKTTITLDEAELATAVREYLHRKGYVTVTRVTLIVMATLILQTHASSG
jgi:hypothetical protein